MAHDRDLTKRQKQSRKGMRAATRALELHLEINGKPKPPKYAQLLAKMNAERAKNGLSNNLTKPPGHSDGGEGRPGR